jgi:CheY-like chemotaxis protein
MPVASVQVLLILPAVREEFLQPLAELRRVADVFECQTTSDALEFLRDTECPPVLVVIAQSRPGEFLHDELDQLVQLAPLARFVLLLGSWCEGETRTGQVWPGATRVFWYDWPGEIARNLPAISEGRFAPWLAPATTLEEERYLFGSPNQGVPEKNGELHSSPTVLVCTRRSSYGEALCTACRQQGYDAIWQRPDQTERIPGVGAILWEGIQLLPAEVAELQALATLWPQTPIIALADFPRLETQARAFAAGAVALLAKPCSLAHLVAQLQHWCPLPLAKGKTSTAEVA